MLFKSFLFLHPHPHVQSKCGVLHFSILFRTKGMVKTASGSLKGCVLDSDMELPATCHSPESVFGIGEALHL